MPRRTLSERITILEQHVDSLQTLPARVGAVESQIVQLRGEMRSEFVAVRHEMRTEFAAVRGEIADVRAEMHALHRVTLEEIHKGDEDTRRYMRVLYEDLVTRIAVLGEGRGPR